MLFKLTKTSEKVFIFICFFLFFLNGFSKVSSTIPIILLAIFFILFKSDELIFKKENLLFILVISSLFFIDFVGIFYSENISHALFLVKAKLPMFVIPLIFLKYKNQILKNEFVFKASYVIGFILGIIISLSYSYLNIADNSFLNSFTHENLVQPLFHHTTIFSLLLNIALLLLYAYFNPKKNSLKFVKWLLFFITASYILLLTSRSGILVMMSISLFIIIKEIWNKKSYLLILPFLGVILLSYYGYNTKNSMIKYRLKEVVNFDSETWNGSNSRIYFWKTSWKVIKENPLFGVGSGDQQDALDSFYLNEDSKLPENKIYNSHNQFFQQGINMGFFGIFLFLSMIIYLFHNAFKTKHYVHLSFIVIVSFYCLFESVFQNQAALVIWTIFNMVFYLESQQKLKTQPPN